MEINIIKNADGTYTLTLEQIKGLEDGDLKLHNGRLYVNGNKTPAAVKFLDIKDVLFTEHRHPDHSTFNQPTQTQIERYKQFPQLPEIKGVHLKSSKLPADVQTAVRVLIEEIYENPNKHPFEWIRVAECFAEFAGEKANPLLLEILNSAIPLKEGMKLEGFSAKEFDEKYLHTRPSLYEQAQQELKLVRAGYKMIDVSPLNLSVELEEMENSKAKQLDSLLRTLHESSNKHRPETFEQFSNLAYSLFELYCSCVDDSSVEDNWLLAIRLQSQYWDSFRGYTITILRLYVDLLLNDQSEYALKTPIPGME